jgi:bifunctional DNA-binding transcriptional regulator/antitoxin component of YhaV-PrlF toxin-antitoxin module
LNVRARRRSSWYFLMIMRIIKVTRGGQISVPADVRRRWNTSHLTLDDQGDRLVIEPAPDDPIAAARGAFAGEIGGSAAELRAKARSEEAETEDRRGPSRP